MASSYTFKDFLARLERSSVAHIKPHYHQNQALFVGRPDMLVTAVSYLSYNKGLALLSAAKYSQAIPMDAYRAVLAQMLKHNTAQMRDQMVMGGGGIGNATASPEATSSSATLWTNFVDPSDALTVFKEVHTAYGNQAPSRLYQSTLRLLGPQRRWADAVKVLKLRQQVNAVTAPMLLDAAVCHATPSKYKEALRLLQIAERTMPSYFAVASSSGGGGGGLLSLSKIGERSLLLSPTSPPLISSSSVKTEERSDLPSDDALPSNANQKKQTRRKKAKELLNQIKALEKEEEEALSVAASVRNPFSLMPPEKLSLEGADGEDENSAAPQKEPTHESLLASLSATPSGGGADESSSHSSSSSSPNSSSSSSSSPCLTASQQAAQEAHVLLSLANILAVTPWAEARQSPLLMGALELIVNGGDGDTAAAMGRERRHLAMERRLLMGGEGITTAALEGGKSTSSSSSTQSLLTHLTDPLPIMEAFTVSYLPQGGKGVAMQRDLLPIALKNVPWEDALRLLLGLEEEEPSSSSLPSPSSLPPPMIPHTSVRWTPSLLAAMLCKAPNAEEASHLARLLPRSFIKHRDTAVTLAAAQLSRRPSLLPIAVGGGEARRRSGAEEALDTLLHSSSVSASSSSSTASSLATLGNSNSTNGDGGDDAADANSDASLLLPNAQRDASRPLPSELVSTLILALWREGKAGRVVDAANLCTVTRSKITPAALVAALESAVRVSIEMKRKDAEEKMKRKEKEADADSDDNNRSFSASAAAAKLFSTSTTVHWQTAVTWALQLQHSSGGSGGTVSSARLSNAEYNPNSNATFSTYGGHSTSPLSALYGSAGGGAATALNDNSIINAYSSTLSEALNPSSASFVREAVSDLERAVIEQQLHQMRVDQSGFAGGATSSRFNEYNYGSGTSSSSLSSATRSIAFIPDRGPPLHHRVLSLLIYLCALQGSPMGALRLIGYAAANNNNHGSVGSRSNLPTQLAHTEEIKALLFAALYNRPQEARLIVETLEKRLLQERGQEKDVVATAMSVKPLQSLYSVLFPPTAKARQGINAGAKSKRADAEGTTAAGKARLSTTGQHQQQQQVGMRKDTPLFDASSFAAVKERGQPSPPLEQQPAARTMPSSGGSNCDTFGSLDYFDLFGDLMSSDAATSTAPSSKGVGDGVGHGTAGQPRMRDSESARKLWGEKLKLSSKSNSNANSVANTNTSTAKSGVDVSDD